MAVHEIRLPWPKPPLSLNDRGHWSTKARKIRDVRRVVAGFVRAAHIPHAPRVQVSLTYFPRDGRRRDEDNLVATYKVVCDAIVDSGVVQDDAPAFMAKRMPVIGPPNSKDPHLVLTIETLLEASE